MPAFSLQQIGGGIFQSHVKLKSTLVLAPLRGAKPLVSQLEHPSSLALRIPFWLRILATYHLMQTHQYKSISFRNVLLFLPCSPASGAEGDVVLRVESGDERVTASSWDAVLYGRCWQ